ncbi:MAG TPA: TraB/GumN family protein [Kofleriaceae bacterium]|nr:TraB/GumN family protein [Kofleriaceae bacterium]
MTATEDVLHKDGTPIHLIGTAHVSARSVEEVREVIHRVKPDVVCVELCKGRYDALTRDGAFRDLDVFKVVREGKGLYLLAHLALGSYQRRMGQKLGVKPGAELLAAIEAAREVGAKVELVDRDINVTLKRTWANLGLWKRSQLMTSLLVGFEEPAPAKPAKPGKGKRGKGQAADDAEAAPLPAAAGKPAEELSADDIEQLKEPKALSEMLAELARALPEIKQPLIDERDAFLMSGIEEAARGAREVVAVVGAAHVPGMRGQFGQPVDRAALAKLPPPSKFWTAVKWLIPILLVAGLVWGAFHSEKVSAKDVVMALVLPTSIGAGALTLLGGGTFLSVLSAVLIAPIAAIHPLLGTGMVVGVVEAWRRKPTVQDCERLPDDIASWRGFFRNPVLRILLVAVLSGLGTMIGMWVGAAWIATKL